MSTAATSSGLARGRLGRGGFLGVARRWWWVLVIAATLASLSGYVAAARAAPVYEGEVRLLVGPINTDLDTLRAAGQLGQTYADLATSGPLLTSTVNDLGLQIAPEALREDVRATANDLTRLLTIRVRGQDPTVAAQIANTLAQKLSAAARQGTERPEGQLTVVDSAVPPTDPVWPVIPLIVILAGFAGIVGGLTLVLVVEYLRDTVRGEDDIEAIANVPFLGSIGRTQEDSITSRVVLGGGKRHHSADYRLVSAELDFYLAELALRSVVVVETDAAQGSGEFAGGLAAVLAEQGRKVVLIDTDPTNGVLKARLQATSAARSASRKSRSGSAQSSTRLQFTGPGGGRVVVVHSAGQSSAEPPETQLESQLEEADLVVVSTPPLDRSSTALGWARAAGAAVLVTHYDRTKMRDLARAAHTLNHMGLKLVTAVMMKGHASRLRALLRSETQARAERRSLQVAPRSQE